MDNSQRNRNEISNRKLQTEDKMRTKRGTRLDIADEPKITQKRLQNAQIQQEYNQHMPTRMETRRNDRNVVKIKNGKANTMHKIHWSDAPMITRAKSLAK